MRREAFPRRVVGQEGRGIGVSIGFVLMKRKFQGDQENPEEITQYYTLAGDWSADLKDARPFPSRGAANAIRDIQKLPPIDFTIDELFEV